MPTLKYKKQQNFSVIYDDHFYHPYNCHAIVFIHGYYFVYWTTRVITNDNKCIEITDICYNDNGDVLYFNNYMNASEFVKLHREKGDCATIADLTRP